MFGGYNVWQRGKQQKIKVMSIIYWFIKMELLVIEGELKST